MRKKDLHDLSKRLLYSSFVILVTAFLLIFAKYLICQILIFFLITALAVLSVWEYGQMLKVKKIELCKGVLEGCTVGIVFAMFLASMNRVFVFTPFILLFLFMFVFFALYFKQNKGAIESVGLSSFGLLYIAIPLGLFLPLIYLVPHGDGRFWLVYLLAVTKSFDIAAYFGGRLYGKRKLAPKISPNKTVEGACFGLVASLLMSILFAYLSINGSIDMKLSYQEAVVLGAILGMIGQFGDLAESMFKRDADIKDSNAIPGLGGVLDMVDSLLFTTPILFFYLNQGLIR